MKIKLALMEVKEENIMGWLVSENVAGINYKVHGCAYYRTSLALLLSPTLFCLEFVFLY
jgi:hypothetical protein